MISLLVFAAIILGIVGIASLVDRIAAQTAGQHGTAVPGDFEKPDSDWL